MTERIMITRRRFLESSLAASACALAAQRLRAATSDPIAPYRTPYKYPELVFKATGSKTDFDGISVDDPIVFRANGRFHMLYIGYDVYDFDNVGFLTSGPEAEKRGLRLDTSEPGNGNGGHEGREYGTELSRADKDALIEYLKEF